MTVEFHTRSFNWPSRIPVINKFNQKFGQLLESSVLDLSRRILASSELMFESVAAARIPVVSEEKAAAKILVVNEEKY